MSDEMKTRIVMEMDANTRKGVIQYYFQGVLEEEHPIQGFEIKESRSVNPIKDENGKIVSIKKVGPTIVSFSMIYDEAADDTETSD